MRVPPPDVEHTDRDNKPTQILPLPESPETYGNRPESETTELGCGLCCMMAGLCPIRGVGKHTSVCGHYAKPGWTTLTEGPPDAAGKPQWEAGARFCGENCCRGPAGRCEDKEAGAEASATEESGSGRALRRPLMAAQRSASFGRLAFR